MFERKMWKNRVVQKPNTYEIKVNSDGTSTLVRKEGNIVEEGTPVNALNMNRIEGGVEESIDMSLNIAKVCVDGFLNMGRLLNINIMERFYSNGVVVEPLLNKDGITLNEGNFNTTNKRIELDDDTYIEGIGFCWR